MNSFDPWYSVKGFKMQRTYPTNKSPSNVVKNPQKKNEDSPERKHWVTQSCFMIETDATENFPTSRTWELRPDGTKILCHYSNDKEKFVRIDYKNGNIYNGTISWEGYYLVGTLTYKDSFGQVHSLNYNKTINSIETKKNRPEKKITLDEIIQNEKENLSTILNANTFISTLKNLEDNSTNSSSEASLADSREEKTKDDLSLESKFKSNEVLSFILPCESPAQKICTTTFSSPESTKTNVTLEEKKSNKKTLSKLKKKNKTKIPKENPLLNLDDEIIRLPNNWVFKGITQLINSKNIPPMPSYGVSRKNENEFYEGSYLPFTKKKSYENQVGQFENGTLTIKNKGILIKIIYENGVVIESEYYPKGEENTFPYFSGKLDENNKPVMGILWYNDEISFNAQINFNSNHTISGNLTDSNISVNINFDRDLTPLRGSGEIYLEKYDTPDEREFIKIYTGPLFWERGFDSFEPDGEGGILKFILDDEEYTFKECTYAEGHLVKGEGTYVTENNFDIFHGTILEDMAKGILICPPNEIIRQNRIHKLTSAGSYSFNFLEDDFKLIDGFGEIYLDENTLFFGKVANAFIEFGIKCDFEPSRPNYFFGYLSTNKGFYKEKNSEIKIGQFNTDEFGKILNLASGFYLTDEKKQFFPIKEVEENCVVNEYNEENITQENKTSVVSNFTQSIIPVLNHLLRAIKYFEEKDKKFVVNDKIKSICNEVRKTCLLIKNNFK